MGEEFCGVFVVQLEEHSDFLENAKIQAKQNVREIPEDTPGNGFDFNIPDASLNDWSVWWQNEEKDSTTEWKCLYKNGDGRDVSQKKQSAKTRRKRQHPDDGFDE